MLPSEKRKDKDNFQRLLDAGHPDILFIRPKSDRKELNYLIEDFADFFSFLELRPFQLKYRFIIVEEIHLINEIISNKLLKALEEPPKNTSIFFLESIPHEHLATLEGRALHISIPSTPPVYEFPKLPSSLKEHLNCFWQQNRGLQSILDSLKHHPEYEQDLKLLLFHLECKRPEGGFEQKEKTLAYMREAQRSKIFHNSPIERHLLLLEALKFHQEHLAD
jgi:hypothetical protein